MFRREFLLASVSFVGLSGCSFKTLDAVRKDKILKACQSDIASTKPLYVDMHCHLLNIRDIDGEAFVMRRFVDEYVDTKNRWVTARIRWATNNIFKKVTGQIPSISEDLKNLKKMMKERSIEGDTGPTSLADICEQGVKNVLTSKLLKNSGFEGLSTSRLFNAANLMATFSEISLFTPSIVDLFEGNVKRARKAEELDFYAMLNLATNGRMVPMVSFTPERQYVAEFDPKTGKRRSPDDIKETPLEVVERAITQLGYIGVKVHPSSGFSPIQNLKYGCLNSKNQSDDFVNTVEFDRITKIRFEMYDQYMQDLFRLCTRLDVPILTHGSTGITTNNKCMRRERPKEMPKEPFTYRPNDPKWKWTKAKEIEWTNSPKMWIKAIQDFNGTGPGSAQNLYNIARRQNGIPTPLSADDLANLSPQEAEQKQARRMVELAKDIKMARRGGGRRVRKLRVCLGHFADSLSYDKDGNNWNVSPWLNHTIDEISKTPGLYLDLAELANIFTAPKRRAQAIEKLTKILSYKKVALRTMYGTDWHMPGVNKLEISNGHDLRNSYADNLRMVSSRYKTRILGQNAVRFFGLQNGRLNNDRLKIFYKTPQTDLFKGFTPEELALTTVDIKNVPWWSRALYVKGRYT